MGASVNGFKERKAKQKLSNNSALVAQSTLMIKKKTLHKIGIGLIMLPSYSSCSLQFTPIYDGKSMELEYGLRSPFCHLIC
jgi:hypothetical protein